MCFLSVKIGLLDFYLLYCCFKGEKPLDHHRFMKKKEGYKIMTLSYSNSISVGKQ